MHIQESLMVPPSLPPYILSFLTSFLPLSFFYHLLSSLFFLPMYIFLISILYVLHTLTHYFLISDLLVSPNYSTLEAFQNWLTLNYHFKEMHRNVCVYVHVSTCVHMCAHMCACCWYWSFLRYELEHFGCQAYQYV